METTKLKTFLAIATYGSFKAAADKLFLSPRAVSKQMNQIEAELGTTLFTREKNNTELTPMGKQFLVSAQDIVNSYNAAVNRIALEKQQKTATCKSASPPPTRRCCYKNYYVILCTTTLKSSLTSRKKAVSA